MSDTFTCAICHETFDKGLTDEEAAEALTNEFPGFGANECDLICEDCYQAHFSPNP